MQHSSTRPLRAHHVNRRGLRGAASSTTLVRHATRRRCLVLAAAALPKEVDVVVVGAGIAGLSAALALQKCNVRPLLLEASDGVGGRVRTDEVEGFKLDRGFQIFLTGYPNARALLDYEALQLKPFYAGALVHFNGRFHRVADPARHLVDGLLSLPNPVGSVADKVRIGVFRLRCLLGTANEMLARPETTTLARLKAEGFSEAMIDRFFRPFLGGIFFDRGLSVSSRLFEFVMRTLALGQNCLPSGGIGAVAQQLAGRLDSTDVVTGARADSAVAARDGKPAHVVLASGDKVMARRGVIVAVEGPESRRILGDALQSVVSGTKEGERPMWRRGASWHEATDLVLQAASKYEKSNAEVAPSKEGTPVGTCNLYFAAPVGAVPQEAVLYLNGGGTGIVNNCCVPSAVSPSYAPSGQALISVSTLSTNDELSDAQLEAKVREELSRWFGAGSVSAWRHLKTYRIPFAQPAQSPPTDFTRPVSLGGDLFVCGDHRESATLDGAIKSGQRAAAALMAQ